MRPLCARPSVLLAAAARRPSALRLRIAHRRLCSGTTPTAASETPPLPVRAGLVGSATALATPLFPVIGLNQLVFRYLTPQQRLALAGGSSMAYFSAMVLSPKLFWYAPLLLPFALGNGATAAAAYAAADGAAGGPRALAAWRALGVPLAGPALGVVTALAAPLTYPLSFALAWPDPNASGAALWAAASDPELYDMVRWLAYNEVMVPCLAVTGAVSGLLLHVGLEPLVVGRPGWPWPRLAGAVLAAVGVGLCALYSAALRVELPHLRDAVAATAPPGAAWWQRWSPDRTACYVDGEDELFWVPRLDDATAELVSKRLRLRRLNAAGGGAGSGSIEYAFEEVGSKAAGGRRAVEAAALREKLADGRLACYASRRAAFFDGTPGAAPLERTHLREMGEALAVGEGLLTDATVLLVAGAVDAQSVERALGRCLPLLASSALADRVRARPDAFNPLARSSWADAAAPAAALPALVADVRLRRARGG